MKITQIRNATLHVDYNHTRFLLDPWLGPKGYMPGFEGAFHAEVASRARNCRLAWSKSPRRTP